MEKLKFYNVAVNRNNIIGHAVNINLNHEYEYISINIRLILSNGRIIDCMAILNVGKEMIERIQSDIDTIKFKIRRIFDDFKGDYLETFFTSIIKEEFGIDEEQLRDNIKFETYIE